MKRTYWQRLKSHPGVPVASVLTLAGALAGSGNESFGPWSGALFGALLMGSLTWLPVLLTAMERDQ